MPAWWGFGVWDYLLVMMSKFGIGFSGDQGAGRYGETMQGYHRVGQYES